MALIYPEAPPNVHDSVTQPSAAFKRDVVNVLLSIVLFIVAYIVLVVAGVLLAIAAGFGGIMLMGLYTNIVTIMLGLGLAGLGLMVIYFLIKFIFKTNETDRSHLLEIKRSDQPILFEFIEKLTHEVNAPFPKRIYVSSDVNASVFYDSGFWSMFLPVRKNLQIGLGLVNATNISEFKAVLAHEFGHFSQRSMKLGSYVYNVNRVIYNLLFDNTDYQQTLEKWGNLSNYFAVFAGLTSGIVMGIQAILKQLYGIINKNYYSLSRQMEFHADAVAASVAGGNHLSLALRRFELAEGCYQDMLAVCNRLVGDNQRLSNLFPYHTLVMQQAARDLKIESKHGLPQIDQATAHRLAGSRVVVKDQWASHPTNDERDSHLNQLNLITTPNHQSAWVVFTNPEALQRQVTDLLYSNVSFKGNPSFLTQEEASELHQREVHKQEFPSLYNGFYDVRNPMEVKVKPTETQPALVSTILTPEVLQIPKRINLLRNEINMLEAIQRPNSGVKTFDFDGQRHTLADAQSITTALKTELADLEVQVLQAEKSLVSQAFHQAELRGLSTELLDRYKHAYSAEQDLEKCSTQYFDIMGILQPAFHSQVRVDQALGINNQLKLNELPIKEHMETFLQNPKLHVWCEPEEAEKIKTYVNEKLTYFSEHRGFDEGAIELFQQAHGFFIQAISKRMFMAKKDLLDWQVQFLN